MTDACTRCGKCVEVCPSTGPAGVTAEPVAVIGGVIDIMRGGEGNESARNWASGCLLHGDCIKACDYGVNPRFLLYMTRIAMAHAKGEAATQRRDGVEGFRKVAREVTHISQLQLDDALLARLGQGAKRPDSAAHLAQERRNIASRALSHLHCTVQCGEVRLFLRCRAE